MKYLLLCNHCGNKVFTNGSPEELKDLVQVAVSPLPKRANGKDKATMEQLKKFKCQKCGYIFHIVKLTAGSEKSKEENTNTEIA
jgi:hypothetical protein